MTAFTYRFAPSMRYLKHLVASGQLGEPRHFRSQRFLDWPETSWGWRQYKDKAGAGDLFDMTIHRIDFAQDLLGPIQSVSGAVARFARADDNARRPQLPPFGGRRLVGLPRRVRQRRRGRLGRDDAGQGLPSRRLRPRMGRDQRQRRLGRLSTARAQRHSAGATGKDLAPVDVPQEYLKPAGSPRDPSRGKAGHGVSLRPGVGIRLGDRRRAARPSPAFATACRRSAWPTPCWRRTPSDAGSIC